MASSDECSRLGAVPPEGYYFVDTKNDLFYYKDDKMHIYKCFDNRTKDFYVCERPYDGLFDHDNWVKLFEFTASAGGIKDLQYLRVSLILDTYNRLEKGWYTHSTGARVTFPPLSIKVKANRSLTKEYDFTKEGFPELPSAEERKYGSTEVEVIAEDAISTVVDIALKGTDNPVLVNMANTYAARGGYLERAEAQEESLFRRSNCNQFLDPQKEGPAAGCYMPGVSVFRGKESEGYPLMEKIVRVDVLAVPVISREDDAAKVSEKVRTIFEIARDNGNDVVVINATGCGVTEGKIADTFLEMVNLYMGCFKKVIFATIGKKII